ncbi:uncharacterized protein LOC105841638 [Bombyx mori]|uniref:Cuticle protein n=1 Tax=Bombyx mori TaxID=7091 RepID=A0A8R2G7T1_BOMMO|nr:uncharacterized protein LOC105841638 [Bombyx mori]
MGRQAFFAVWCLLAFVEALCDSTSAKSVAKDNISAESAPRLYRNVPVGVYASATPYGSYSIPVKFVSAPRTAASRLVPVKEAYQNAYLKDSYGNRFIGSPQSLPYKTTYPQQFVQLQELPAHLSQPIVAAAPSYQYRQPTPFIVNSHYTLPLQQVAHRFGSSQPYAFGENIKTLAPNAPATTQSQSHPTAQQQSTSHKAVYANTQSQDNYNVRNGPKYQRLQQGLKDAEVIRSELNSAQDNAQNDKAKLQDVPAKETAITTVVNGQKTVINLDTKPVLPLLDLSLLEPLTFANPLVPQVQHFLPRINQATYVKLPKPEITENKNYQKEFMIQKTKSYDSGLIKGKPQKLSPKNKVKRPQPEDDTDIQRDVPHTPTVTVKDTSNASPEISYEINSPNYKETYKEKAVSYNKETNSEPVHYTYGSNTAKKPVHYSYSHSSNEPAKIKKVYYHSSNGEPKQLIYKFNSEEQNKEQNGEEKEKSQEAPSQHAENSSGESHFDGSEKESSEEQHEDDEAVQQNSKHLHPEHREEYHEPPSEQYKKEQHNKQPQYHSRPHATVQNAEQFHPVTHYEENIQLIPPNKLGHIKVDPGQHVQQQPPQPQNQSPPQNFDHPIIHERPHNVPQHIHEKTRKVIIQEETPEEMHSIHEQMKAEMIDHEENNEEDFEKAYKDAAFGFPAYERHSDDVEKDIYNPEIYGIPRDHSNFEIEHVPFQQYQDHGDEFPKTTRVNYKDARDKTKEDYYLDYSISRPQSLTDRYRNKVDYYKLYKNQKPEKYTVYDTDKNQEKQSSKYTVVPYVFGTVEDQKPKQTFAKYQAKPLVYEYDYSKAAPRDNSAYASQPYQNYKSKTLFVEPQFQYGFEPIAIPRLLDSELAAMASNNRPESEKPGMRKKIYKENFYIKKTSTLGGEPTS